MVQPSPGTITNLTRTLRVPGFFPGAHVDQFMRVLTFQAMGGYGRSVQINRTDTTLGGTAFYDPSDTLTATQGDTALTTFDFQRIAGTAQVDVADIAASGDANNQLALQVAMRKVSLLRTLSAKIVLGSGVAPEMKGIGLYASVGNQEIDLVGAVPTLADYHRLVALVSPSGGALGNGNADALVVSSVARRQLMSLLEAAGGPISSFANDPKLGHPVLLFEGLPVYVSDSMPAGSPTVIFAVKLHGPTGIRVLHVGGRSSDYGIVVDDVPNQMGVSERAKVVRGYYTLFVPEETSVAQITNADVSAFVP